VLQGIPRLGTFIAKGQEPDPLVPASWTYKTQKFYRMLPEFYFGQIAGHLGLVKDEDAQAWLARHAVDSPISKDPLLVKYMLTIMAQVDHEDRARTLKSVLRRWKREPQVIATAFDAARRGRVKDSTFARGVVAYLKYRSRDVQVAAIMYLERAAPSLLKRELPKILKSKESDVRMMGVSAAIQCKSSPKVIFPLLNDPDWRVRVSVFRSLGLLADPDVVPALIERLGKETHPRAVDDLVDTLRRLTGEDMGRFHAAWAGWWKENKVGADIRWRDAAELGEIKAEQAATGRTASYYGLEVVSNFACFIMDTSKSMIEKYDVAVEEEGSGGGRTKVKRKKGTGKTVKKRKIDYARENLKRVLTKLPKRMNFNIITFSSTAKPWNESLVPNSDENRTAARMYLDDLEPSGATNIFDTLVLALGDEDVDTIYLLSDGAPTTGTYVDNPRILEEIRRLNLFRKVKINTIGFNLKGEAQELMRDLADQNFGAFVAK
jgi:hypothetical protein